MLAATVSRGKRHDTHFLYPARIDFQHVEFVARNCLNDLAANRNAPENREDQTADRIDVLAMLANFERRADLCGQFLQIGACIHDEHAVGFFGDHDFFVVMFVFDIADDHFDNVFQRDQTIGAAIFVDDQSHLDMGRLHPRHQSARHHGWRHEQDLAHEIEFTDRLGEIDAAHVELGGLVFGCRLAARGTAARGLLTGLLGDVVENIADMDHAARVVQRFGIDRHTRMAGFFEKLQHFPERRGNFHGLDVGARNHHVFNADFAQAQDIVQHRLFFGREC